MAYDRRERAVRDGTKHFGDEEGFVVSSSSSDHPHLVTRGEEGSDRTLRRYVRVERDRRARGGVWRRGGRGETRGGPSDAISIRLDGSSSSCAITISLLLALVIIRPAVHNKLVPTRTAPDGTPHRARPPRAPRPLRARATRPRWRSAGSSRSLVVARSRGSPARARSQRRSRRRAITTVMIFSSSSTVIIVPPAVARAPSSSRRSRSSRRRLRRRPRRPPARGPRAASPPRRARPAPPPRRPPGPPGPPPRPPPPTPRSPS